jgi:hypothetical protein
MEDMSGNQNPISDPTSVVRGLASSVGVSSASSETPLRHSRLLDMVYELKMGGFPVEAIAQFAGVERKTIYTWLDGSTIPHSDYQDRVGTVYPILKERFDSDFALMYRFLRAKDRAGNNLESLFSRPTIDVDALKRLLVVLNTSIEAHKNAEARKKAKPYKSATGRNGATMICRLP